MKKLLLILSICSLVVPAAFSQDDQYYTGNETSTDMRAQEAPPALPEYTQPPCPYDGYMWSPGYWAWGPAGYYWVPGVWVLPPRPGLLWTPGYWGFYGGWYGWHHGYWGPHVGYYGGVCYGFGYGGVGFYGGRWAGGAFQYNTAVWHVNTTVVHNTYMSTEGVNTNVVTHASYNGPGGVQARPTATEQQAMSESHVQPTSAQVSHQTAASTNKSQLASVNHGTPATTAMDKPGGKAFSPQGHPAAVNNAAKEPANGTNNASHPANTEHPATNTNNKAAEGSNGNTKSQPASPGNGSAQPAHNNAQKAVSKAAHGKPHTAAHKSGGSKGK